MPKVKISRLQVLTIFANLVYGKSIGFSSGAIARMVGNDNWLSVTIAFAFGLPVMALMAWLAGRFGEEPPGSYVRRLMGRFLGSVLLMLLALFFFTSFITSAITIELHVNDFLMTETPLIIFAVGYTLLSMYGAYLGLEVVARLAVGGLVMSGVINFLMIIGSLDHMKWGRLQPLFDHGVIPITMASGVALHDVATATLGALVLLPMVDTKKSLTSLSVWGLLAGFLLVIIWPLFEIGVLGPEVTAQYLISCMQLARSAELSVYLHRYELLMVLVFVYGVLTQSIVCLYAACELTAAALPWKMKRWILYVVFGLMTIPANWLLAHDRDRYSLFLAGPLPALALPIGIGLPLLLCVVALLRPGIAKRGRPNNRPRQ